ncbi:expressed unknown protein [Seminavis robusta]|uniref:Uncharacterized protein n=1 Tax=Seminavis robusta TaxID=568900 RepID=A0A9N8HFA4_9STRA|nr:expressed unknown protein [Seminavis robusta]|eukprot:Sro446_g144740.1 n/a (246) ;mRNA; r:52291-53028
MSPQCQKRNLPFQENKADQPDAKKPKRCLLSLIDDDVFRNVLLPYLPSNKLDRCVQCSDLISAKEECRVCQEPICAECQDPKDHSCSDWYLRCVQCNKADDPDQMHHCPCCNGYSCRDCAPVTCITCHKKFLQDCCSSGDFCGRCEAAYQCGDCAKSEFRLLYECAGCGETACSDCIGEAHHCDAKAEFFCSECDPCDCCVGFGPSSDMRDPRLRGWCVGFCPDHFAACCGRASGYEYYGLGRTG